MKSLSQEEQQDLEYDMFQVSAVKRNAAPQGQIRMGAGDAQLKGRIKEVDLNSPFFERIAGTVGTNVDLNALGVTSMVVKLRYGTRDDGTTPKDTAEFVLTGKGQKGSYAFMMDRNFSMELEYQIVVKYEPGFAIGDPSLEAVSPWIKTTTRNLDVDPAVSSIECTLNYDDPSPQAIPQATAVLTQQKPQGKFHIRPLDPQNRAYRLTSTYQFNTGQTSVVEIKATGAKTFVINQPTQLAVPITVIASDPLKHFSRMAAELSYKPVDSDTEQTKLLTFSSNGETQTWTVFRSSTAEKPEYQWRLTTFATNGSERRTDWQSSKDQLLVVGEVFESVLQVSVRMLVPDFKEAGLLGARLHLQYDDAASGAAKTKDMVFMAPSLEPVVWAVPKKAGGGGNYNYTITWIGSDGKLQVVGPRTTADEELLLHPAL
jgi:hypothetical protein